MLDFHTRLLLGVEDLKVVSFIGSEGQELGS